jgi:hypothetical protein
MQQTRSGHSRWRPSLLILVFYAPRQGRAGDVTRVASTDRRRLNLRAADGCSFRSSHFGLALTPCPTRRVTALATRAKRRATPPLSTKELRRGQQRGSLLNIGACRRMNAAHLGQAPGRATSLPQRALTSDRDIGARMVATCRYGA